MGLGLRLAIVAALLAGVAALAHPKSQWRAGIIARKLSGSLSGLTWSELVSALGSPRWGVGDPRLTEELFSGEVQVGRFEAGVPCPVEWRTRYGSVWAQRADGDALETWFLSPHLEGPALTESVLDVGSRTGLFALDALARGARGVVLLPRDGDATDCLLRTFSEEISAGKVTLLETQGEDESIGETLRKLDVDNVELIRLNKAWAKGGFSLIEPFKAQHSARVAITDEFSLPRRIAASAVDPDSPCPVLWETRLGSIWGRYGEADLLEWLDLELVDHKVYANQTVTVETGDVVLDVGGHLGMFTLQALELGASKVVVFEPNPGNVTCLRKTFSKQIESGRVILVDAAAWEERGTLKFALASEDRGHESARGGVSEQGELTVRAEAIDSIVQELELKRLDYIKMDIEGGERHALKGARRTIKDFAPKMALCVYHRDDDPEVVPRVVSDIRPEYEMRVGTNKHQGQVYFF